MVRNFNYITKDYANIAITTAADLSSSYFGKIPNSAVSKNIPEGAICVGVELADFASSRAYSLFTGKTDNDDFFLLSTVSQTVGKVSIKYRYTI